MRFSWWFYFGHHEIERMRYRGPFERMSIAIGQALLPAFERFTVAKKSMVEAFARMGDVLQPTEKETP